MAVHHGECTVGQPRVRPITRQGAIEALTTATLGTLFLAVSPGLCTGNALVVTLLVQLGVWR